MRLRLFAALALGAIAARGLVPENAELLFSNRLWKLMDSGTRRIGPGPNRFSAANVALDSQGILELALTREGGGNRAAQLVLEEALGGYGRYELELGPFTEPLDPQAVFGFFTWDDSAPEYANREIDIEIARWADPAGPNLHFTVQPHGQPGQSFSAELDLSRGALLAFTWRPERVEFSAREGQDGREIDWSYRGPAWNGEKGLFKPGAERLNLNLWSFKGKAIKGETRFRVLRFEFTPLGELLPTP